MTCKIFAALSAMPILLSLQVAAFAQTTASPPKTIDVTGHGDSSAKPDLMTLSFAVTSHSDSADECTRNESEVSQRVVSALKATLGDSAKVTTADFSFNPNIEYGNGNATPTPSAMRAEEPPATWEFKADVNVFADSMQPLGDLIETGLAAGATSVGQSGVSQMPDEDATAPAVPRAMIGSASSYPTGSVAYQRLKRMYYISLSVVAQGISPPDSFRKGAVVVDKVEAALKKQIGARGKVEVTDFAVTEINPQQRPGFVQYQPPQQPQHKVYDAQMTASAETSKLELLGPTVEAAVKAGAARLNQVSFTLKDDSSARKEAIEKASADAKAKAETLASSMGVKLKGILRISTNAQARPYVVYGNQYTGGMSSGAAMMRGSVSASQQAQMPITPREVSFSADVNVTYQTE